MDERTIVDELGVLGEGRGKGGEGVEVEEASRLGEEATWRGFLVEGDGEGEERDEPDAVRGRGELEMRPRWRVSSRTKEAKRLRRTHLPRFTNKKTRLKVSSSMTNQEK